MTLALCHATVEPIHLGCTSIYIVYCVPFKRLTHLKAVECIFSTLTVVWIAVPRIHKNVLWSNFCGEFDLDYFGKYALEQLPFLRIARAMCYLCMGRVLDWEGMHKIFSDEFVTLLRFYRADGRSSPRTCGLFGEVSLDMVVAKEPCY